MEYIPGTVYIAVYGGGMGVTVKWDGGSTFFIEATNQNFTNSICGLCGNFNGDSSDDLVPKGHCKKIKLKVIFSSLSIHFS